ncbi:MAG: SDR family NAD(P)-dependent oxidoreductase [Jatrophihabitans sp.]|uniref:SDR family NAD(P)-dependent oxidoreductase n=1 Tax=Jatrophihabitans sp. TaxID=1932789 RepID=UPI003F7FC7D6
MDRPTISLVTGAGRGLGVEVARQLAAHGYQVIVTGRDEARLAEVVAGLPGDGHRALRLDVTDAEQVQALPDRVGELDVLVNNAAAYVDWTETATNADLGAARAVLETNLVAPWALIQALLPVLRRSAHPRIVNVASGAGSHGDPDFGLTRRGGAAASYGISKAALLALTSTVAAELAETPVIVNAVCPGLTATYPGAEAMGAHPIGAGAESVVWAALVPDNGPRGGFFRHAVPVPW